MSITLTVEDGSGVTGANCYISLADAATYFTNRGVTAWTGTDEAKKAAIIKAADYLDQHYKWKGVKSEEDQAMKWPRRGVADEEGWSIDSDEIPAAVVNANAALALEALNGDLEPENINITSLKIGSSLSFNMKPGRPQQSFTAVNKMLRGLTVAANARPVGLA